MTQKTFAKFFLMLVMVTFISNCSTVKGWFGGKARIPISPRMFWPRKASRI